MLNRTLLIAVAAAVAGSAFSVQFTFDSTSEGWTKGNYGGGFGDITTGTTAADWVNPGGNGAIFGVDQSAYAFHFSPNLGCGFGHLLGDTLSYKFRSSGQGGMFPQVLLVSGSSFLVLNELIPASGELLKYSYKLDTTESWYFNSSPYYNFGSAKLATNAEIQGVLSDLRYIGISTDITGGGDETWLDDFRLGAVPEPASMTALALGALALLRRRRR